MVISDIEEKLERTIYEALRVTSVKTGFSPDIALYDIDNPDDDIAEAAQLAYEAKLRDIHNQKGFSIDIFNYGTSQARGMKKVPRIVIQTENFYPGNTGLDTTPKYELNPTTGNYEMKISPQMVSDFYFNIHLVANTIRQIRILHGIMANSIPRMGYMKWYDENGLRPSHNIFIKYLSPMEADFLSEGIIEKIYRFHITDAHEIEDQTVDTQVTPIKEIDLEIKGKDFEDNLNIK